MRGCGPTWIYQSVPLQGRLGPRQHGALAGRAPVAPQRVHICISFPSSAGDPPAAVDRPGTCPLLPVSSVQGTGLSGGASCHPSPVPSPSRTFCPPLLARGLVHTPVLLANIRAALSQRLGAKSRSARVRLRHAGPRRACGVPSPSSCSRVQPSWCLELPSRPPGWRPQAETTRGVPTPSLAGKVDVPKRGSLTRVSAAIRRLVTQTLRKLRPPNPRAFLAPALHPRPGDQSPASPTHPRARHVTLEAIHPLRGQGRGLWAPSSPFLTGALGASAGRGGSTQCLQGRGVRCTHATLPEALWSPTAPGTHSTSKTTPHAPGTQPGTVPTVGDLSSRGPS